MYNLIILDVLIPGKGWQEPRIFNEDTEVVALDLAIEEAKKQGHEPHTKLIHGMAVEPLKRYFKDHI